MKTLTAEQEARRAELRARNERHQNAWNRIAKFARGGASSATEEQQAQINREGGAFSNEERAELEELDFIANPPEQYFAYPSQDLNRITGFMGNKLALVTRLGSEFRSNLGDTRRSFRAVGINGLLYVGTIYGTYARMRLSKA